MRSNSYRTRNWGVRRIAVCVYGAIFLCVVLVSPRSFANPRPSGEKTLQYPLPLATKAVQSAAIPVKKPSFVARLKAAGVSTKRKLIALVMSFTHADEFIRLTKKLESGAITELEFMEEHAQISRRVGEKLAKVASIVCALGVGEVLRQNIVKQWTKPQVFKRTGPTISQRIKSWVGMAVPHEKKYTLDKLITTPEVRKQLETIIDTIKTQNDALKPTAFFFGPPGTGKTLAANTIADETGSIFIEVTPADFDRFLHLGDRLEELENIFSYAEKQKRHYLIFFDEIEAMAQSRLTTNENKFLTKLLTLLSTPSRWFTFIAASNRPEQIDTALWNRMIYKIEFKLPNGEEREKILRLYVEADFKKETIDQNFDYAAAARLLEGMSARAIKGFVQRLFNVHTLFSHKGEKLTFDFLKKVYDEDNAAEVSLKKYQDEAYQERLKKMAPGHDRTLTKDISKGQEPKKEEETPQKSSVQTEQHTAQPTDVPLSADQANQNKHVSQENQPQTGSDQSNVPQTTASPA